jgi:voltage-gated potassium channel
VKRPADQSDLRRQLLLAGFSLVTVALVGATGYHVIGDGRWSWPDCLYMTVITLSTVGFGETLPGMNAVDGARLWTAMLILFGSGSLVFFVSTITALVVESDIRGAVRMRRMQKEIDKLSGHIIVVGVGATGIHVVDELLASGVPFVVVEASTERIETVRTHLGNDFLWVQGDATLDAVLEEAGILRASALATTLKEDKDNAFVTITARALNPKLRIVAKVTEDNAATKLTRAGADITVSPSFIGGQRLASELVRPGVVKFLDNMRAQDLRGEEVPIPEGSSLVGTELRNSGIRHQTKVLVLAVRDTDGSYLYNPGPDFTLTQGQTLVVLCRTSDLEQLLAGIQSGSIGRVTG